MLEMNYYKDRTQAGKLLADELKDYNRTNCIVIALSKGAVVVGAEIAKGIHSSLFILSAQNAEPDRTSSGSAISSVGVFSYNTRISLGGLEEDDEAYKMFTSKYQMDEFLKLNKIAGKDGTIPKALLKRHNVILVSDGLNNALSLQIATYFLRPIHIKKLIIATPIASGQAIDKMHILVDQIFCLQATENFITTNHYYDDNDIPDDKTVVEIMQNIVLNWPQSDTK